LPARRGWRSSARPPCGRIEISVPASCGADATLREPGRQCRRWLAFHEKAWQGVKDQDWGRFVRSWSGEDLDTLTRLLGSTDGALQEVAGACRAVRAALAGLRQRAEQK
jgi:hypothetical protein